MDLYFTDVESVGREKVPRKGPVIFAANHPNSIMDTVILGTELDRQIHYMAKSGLFKNPMVAAVFDRCGVIPIYKNPKGDTSSNQEAFQSAFDVLADDGCIGIFPEGQNSREREVLRIKTGTARIALGAERQHDYSLGVKIVPVGLNFENRDRFFSQVLVRFGEPIDAFEYAELHATYEQDAVRDLTDRIADDLRDLATHIEGERVRGLVESIYRIYGRQLFENMVAYRSERTEKADRRGYDFDDLRDGRIDDDVLIDELASGGGRRGLRSWLWDKMRSADKTKDDLEEKLWVQQRIADAVNHYEENDPELVRDLRLRIWRYIDHVRQVRLKHDMLERPPETLSVRKEGLKLTAYALIFALPAVWGFVHNVVPYTITKFAALKAPDEAMRAFAALLVGMIVFPLFYAAYGAGLWFGTDVGPWFVAGYLLSLIPTGFFFLSYRQRLARYRSRILVRTMFRTEEELIEELAEERLEIIDILDGLRDRFRKAEEAQPSSIRLTGE